MASSASARSKSGRLIEDMRVVRSGLTRDRVIISGVQRARPGRKVNAQAGEMSAFPSGVSRGENAKLEMPAAAHRPGARAHGCGLGRDIA